MEGNILITGGSGTLGHAIVRTAEREGWDCTFTIYSRSELRQAQMRVLHPHLRYVLGDVRDHDRLAATIVGHDVVVHAAAMKRIPECEQHPSECCATNVGGSVNVVRACIAAGVKRCIGISTDKACRAVTAYGASKLAMEKLFQSQAETPTIFTCVRYGNVVASNGSVIPIWRGQAARGEPLTVTDPGMTRFWLAPSNAVQLVEWAASEGWGPGLVIVPRLAALSIAELAHIIAPGADIVPTGLRSIEKRHEDLIHVDEFASETKNHYVIGGSLLATDYPIAGHAYTSDTAPRLTREQFLAMLEEAESYD